MDTIKRKYKSNEIIVNRKSNFKSHLVKSQEIMDKSEFDRVIIRGMGKATFRAINLALQLNSNNHDTFELRPRTYSVEILEERNKKPIRGADRDGFNPDDIRKTNKKVTHVPAIEIVVSKSKIELDRVHQERKRLQSSKKK